MDVFSLQFVVIYSSFPSIKCKYVLYLILQGDLEHLILVPDSGAVVQQCSTTKVSLLDRALLEKSSYKTFFASSSDAKEENTNRLRRRHHPLFTATATTANGKHLTTTAFEAEYVYTD